MCADNTEHIETHPLKLVSFDKQTTGWISWIHPQSYWDVVVNHMPVALMTGIPLLLSCLVPLHLLPLVPCTLMRITGYPCPFCGITRSFWAISAGDWSFALYNYPLSVLLYGLIALVFAQHACALIFGVRITRRLTLRFSRLKIRWGMGFVSVLFLINWVYRLSMGLK
jgi:hypothetical protein